MTGRGPMRTTFAVGKLTRTTTEIVVVEPEPAPILGPWVMRALVRSTGRHPSTASATIH